MKKDAYYFYHDHNARNDEKMLCLRSDYGMEGYGIYWCLVEMLHESPDSKLSHALIKGISYQLKVNIAKLKQVIASCICYNLFISDDVKFWSERVIKNKVERDQKYTGLSEKRSVAGRLGNEKRWANRKSIANDRNGIANDRQRKEKEIKEKENKGEEIKEKEDSFLWTNEVKKILNDYIWKEKFCRDKNLSPGVFDNWLLEFINDIELKEDFKELKELKSHFTNWFNLKSKSNGNSLQKPGGKATGAHQLLEELRADYKPQ